jgi:hypothetical protein
LNLLFETAYKGVFQEDVSLLVVPQLCCAGAVLGRWHEIEELFIAFQDSSIGALLEQRVRIYGYTIQSLPSST